MNGTANGPRASLPKLLPFSFLLAVMLRVFGPTRAPKRWKKTARLKEEAGRLLAAYLTRVASDLLRRLYHALRATV